MTEYQLIQTIYWLALSTWFGGALFVAIAAPVIHRTLREANPILPNVLSVNLEHEHGNLLAGSVVGNLLRMLGPVQFTCAAVILLMLLGQWLVLYREAAQLQVIYGEDWGRVVPAIVRSCLFIIAVVLLMYDRRIVWPRAWTYRQEYIDHADEPEIANPAKDMFDRYHRESVRVLLIIIGVLSLMIVFSSPARP